MLPLNSQVIFHNVKIYIIKLTPIANRTIFLFSAAVIAIGSRLPS